MEYKHGEVREELEYELQVCAQAMCIEEMTGCSIKYGYLYYKKYCRIYCESNERSTG